MLAWSTVDRAGTIRRLRPDLRIREQGPEQVSDRAIQRQEREEHSSSSADKPHLPKLQKMAVVWSLALTCFLLCTCKM